MGEATDEGAPPVDAGRGKGLQHLLGMDVEAQIEPKAVLGRRQRFGQGKERVDGARLHQIDAPALDRPFQILRSAEIRLRLGPQPRQLCYLCVTQTDRAALVVGHGLVHRALALAQRDHLLVGKVVVQHLARCIQHPVVGADIAAHHRLAQPVVIDKIAIGLCQHRKALGHGQSGPQHRAKARVLIATEI